MLHRQSLSQHYQAIHATSLFLILQSHSRTNAAQGHPISGFMSVSKVTNRTFGQGVGPWQCLYLHTASHHTTHNTQTQKKKSSILQMGLRQGPTLPDYRHSPRSIYEAFVILRCYATEVGIRLQTFQDNL